MIAASFILGYKLAGKKENLTPVIIGGDFDTQDAKIFWKTWDYIKNNYADPSKIDHHRASFEAARGLLKSLNDPYSDLMTQEEGKIFEEDLSGSFGGVGIEIGMRNGMITVISPLEGTPAYQAGIKAGDIIVSINGTSTENMSLEKAVSLIRGPEGTKVKLGIMREGWKEPKDFELIRAKIEVPVVKYEFIQPNIGYIKLNTFIATTLAKFSEAMVNLSNQGAERFIIDLRNNPGGYLEVAIRLGELFVPRGKIIVIQQSRDEHRVFRSEGPGLLSNAKMVILVNKGSASASEIFAAALRDNLGVKLIGEKTFGKGTVQQMFNVEGNLLKLTVAYWLTPKNIKIEGTGLTPDIIIKDNSESNKDPIKEKAIEYLKNI